MLHAACKARLPAGCNPRSAAVVLLNLPEVFGTGLCVSETLGVGAMRVVFASRVVFTLLSEAPTVRPSCDERFGVESYEVTDAAGC